MTLCAGIAGLGRWVQAKTARLLWVNLVSDEHPLTTADLAPNRGLQVLTLRLELCAERPVHRLYSKLSARTGSDD